MHSARNEFRKTGIVPYPDVYIEYRFVPKSDRITNAQLPPDDLVDNCLIQKTP